MISNPEMAAIRNTKSPSPALRPRTAAVAYWGLTLFVALTGISAGVLDLLRLPPLFGLLIHLGYPPYFSAILGVWKILGGLALLAPRYPRLKEWAYAGMFIDYSSATFSHLATADGFTAALGPILSAAALIGSWSLRPPSRRLVGAGDDSEEGS